MAGSRPFLLVGRTAPNYGCHGQTLYRFEQCCHPVKGYAALCHSGEHDGSAHRIVSGMQLSMGAFVKGVL